MINWAIDHLSRLLCVGLLALTAAGCRDATNPHLQDSPEVPDLAPPPVFPSLVVVANDPSALSGPTQPLLKLNQLRYILVRLHTRTIGQAVQRATFKVVNPHGATYLVRRLAYSTDESVVPLTEPIDPSKPDVLLARPVPGGHGLDAVMVVGGTNFKRRPMTGMWTFSMELESGDRAQQTVEIGAMP